MDFIEVKVEIDEARCKTCLSVGRRLFPLGNDTKLLMILMSETPLKKYTEDMFLCWECVSVLRNVLRFQQRVTRANEILEMQQKSPHTLSTLTTTIIDDINYYTFYENEPITELHESETEFDNNGSQYNINLEHKDIEIKSEVPEKPVKKTTQNKWAKKRALQNKKPKFKILTDLKTEDNFRRIEIDVMELTKCMKKERDSEYFIKSRFKCEDCVLGFEKEKHLFEHVRNVHNVHLGSYTCDICKRRIKNKHQLISHIKNHCYKYVCKICDYQCLNKMAKINHLKLEHRNVFQCLKCELMFGCRRDVITHYKDWHEKYICDTCGVSFKMRYCIKGHIRKQHSAFECKQCNKVFARYNGLWLHNKTRHNTSSQQAYCVECDKLYVDIYRYRWHLANSARHKAKRKVSVPCPGCDKVFSKSIYMKDHYNLVHLKNYKYRCGECDKNFIRNADLVKHRRRVHEGIRPPKDKICYICGRGFTTNKILTNHIRIHTGERPHRCELCTASFTQRSALLSHARALHRISE